MSIFGVVTIHEIFCCAVEYKHILTCVTWHIYTSWPCLYLQAETWINEKRQIANDESFRDPTNLENKLQKHQEFEAEVNANEQRIQNIAQVRALSL